MQPSTQLAFWAASAHPLQQPCATSQTNYSVCVCMCVCAISTFLSVMLGMNVLLRLIHMSMSHLFRLDIPFLLQLQPFHYSVLKSLHHFMNHPLPFYLGTKKAATEYTQEERDKAAGMKELQILHSHQSLFPRKQPKREAICTEVLLRLQRALRVLHISISWTQLSSRILNMNKYESWDLRAEDWLNLIDMRASAHSAFYFNFPNTRNQCKIMTQGLLVHIPSLVSFWKKNLYFLYVC